MITIEAGARTHCRNRCLPFFACLCLTLALAACGGTTTIPVPATATATGPAPSPAIAASVTAASPTPLPTATTAPLPPSALTPTPLAPATVPIIAATPGASAIPSGQVVTVTAGSAVNLRADPDTSAAVVIKVPPGAEAAVTEADVVGSDPSTRWVRVTYQGRDGYLRSDLIGSPHAPAPTALPAAPTVAVPTATGQATAAASDYQLVASVSNSTPTDNSRVTVTARLTRGGVGVAGASMTTAWHYKTTTSACSGGPSGADGAMSCTRDISRATKGFTVRIDVVVTYQGQTYRASTGFTPR